MSCAENETGPFVVFLIPAVVGCLTILLARRWASSQASSSTSTAVSRRRKIIKDPLIKRPLPPVACKMVPPGPKKATTAAKKGSCPEEDMNGTSKRVNRSQRVSPPSVGHLTAGAEGKLPECSLSPKHIPFPYIPQDGELLFEAMTFMFTVVAMCLQYLNIYRTSWWLPNQVDAPTMNFYLIDRAVVGFVVVVLARRVLYSATMAAVRAVADPKEHPGVVLSARFFVLGVLFAGLGWCSYLIIMKYPPIQIFYLCYPVVIYVVLFGLQVTPFLELGGGQTVLHSCSSDPQQITAEVEAMRRDFNSRASKILFNSIVGAYYSSFIPCCFAQPQVYYDVYGASQQVALVWGGLCGRYLSQVAGAAVCDTPHRAALHLPLVDNNDPGGEPGCSKDSWTPLHAHHSRFYTVFKNPSSLLRVFLCLQLCLIVLHLCLLFSSIPWHNFLSTLILLFMNYYTAFKMIRDYLVAYKVYKAESMIQDKNAALSANN